MKKQWVTGKIKFTTGKWYSFVAISFVFILLCSGCGEIKNPERKLSPLPHTRDFHDTRFGSFIRQISDIPEGKRDSAVSQYLANTPHSPVIEHDSIVILFWYGIAGNVAVNGDLQWGWSAPDTMKAVHCGLNTFFYVSYTLPTDTRLDYVLMIDSLNTTDPRNPFITPSGYTPHSEIAMPGFKRNPVMQDHPDIAHGAIDSILFDSQDTSISPRIVRVYLPAGYDSLSKCDVLFILNGFEAMDFMNYPTVLDNLIAAEENQSCYRGFHPNFRRACRIRW